jgi:hypothetical protein
MAMQAYSMYEQNKAAGMSADLARSVAQHNAALDIQEAKQIELDTGENIRALRAEDEVYVSRQQTAYAANGVLSSGSPLAVEASTVGRMEQRIQQMYTNSQLEQQKRYESAKVGVRYGEAKAAAIKTENFAAMLKSGANLLSSAYGGYSSGMFAGGSGGSGLGGGVPSAGDNVY